jgi:CHASE2 domain-containing sensor protein
VRKERDISLTKIFFNWDNLFATILVVAVMIFLPIFFNLDFLDPIQNTLQDFQITDMAFSHMENTKEVKPDTNIVLVNISKLERDEIAQQIKVINRYHPKVIGIDSFFREQKDSLKDASLSQSLSEVDNLVLVGKIDKFNIDKLYWDTLEKSHPEFQHGTTGYANFIINDDQFRTVRHFTPVQKVKDSIVYAFAVEIASIYNPQATKKFLARGNETEIISFRGNSDKFITYDFKDFFRSGKDLSRLKDKIVLMGYIGPTLNVFTNEDMFFTPMNDKFVGKSYPDMYGVVVWANIISMILNGNHYEQIPDWLAQFLTLLIIYFNMAFLTFLRNRLESLYEAVSIFWTFGQMIAIIAFILWFFNTFRIELRFEGAFLAILIVKQIYETWRDSLKALFVQALRKRKIRAIRLKLRSRREVPVED